MTVGSPTIIAAGGAAGVTTATLDQGLPDVRTFRDLSFAEPSIIHDPAGRTELARSWEERPDVVELEVSTRLHVQAARLPGPRTRGVIEAGPIRASGR